MISVFVFQKVFFYKAEEVGLYHYLVRHRHLIYFSSSTPPSLCLKPPLSHTLSLPLSLTLFLCLSLFRSAFFICL